MIFFFLLIAFDFYLTVTQSQSMMLMQQAMKVRISKYLHLLIFFNNPLYMQCYYHKSSKNDVKDLFY